MKPDTESIIKDIKRKTRRKFNTEEKIRIVLEGLRGEASIAEICRKCSFQRSLTSLSEVIWPQPAEKNGRTPLWNPATDYLFQSLF